MQGMEANLIESGCVVEAVTFSRQYPDALFPGESQYTSAPPPEMRARRLLDTLNPISWFGCARTIRRREAELVVFSYWHPFLAPALGTLARRMRSQGIRVVCVVHNALPHERKRGDRLLARFALQACDGLVVMSDSVRKDVESLGLHVPIRTTPHPTYDLFGEGMPVADARAALGFEASRPVLLFFGFIRRYKGLHVLLEAMPMVLRRIPNVLLVVAGEFYADEEALRLKAEPLGDAVRFVASYIPDDKVPHYFCAANVVVQPYVSATQSGVAQIAFHFGRPVITTDVGGLAEIVPDDEAGLVVPPENPEALADAIIRYFDEGMEARLAEGVGREREKYSWDRLFEAIEDVAGKVKS